MTTVRAVEALVFARRPLLASDIVARIYSADDLKLELTGLFRDNPALLAAIACASPSLARVWASGETPTRRAVIKTAMYVVRMSTRSTPNGLMAGIGQIEVGNATTVSVGSRMTTHTTPGIAWWNSLLKEFARDDCDDLRMTLNPIVQIIGDRVYVLFIPQPGTVEVSGTSLRCSTGVRAIMDELSSQPNGSMRAGDLARAVAARQNVPVERARGLVGSLRDSGLLIPLNVHPAIGRLVDEDVAALAGAVSHKKSYFTSTLDACAAVDRVAVMDRQPRAYLDLHAQISEAEATGIALRSTLGVTWNGTLGSNVLSAAEQYAKLLLRTTDSPMIERASEIFDALYEGTDRVVPLLEFVTQLPTEGKNAPRVRRHGEEATERRRALGHIVSSTGRDRISRYIVSPDELAKLCPPPERAGFTAEVGFRVLAESLQDLSGSAFRIAPSPMFGSAGAGRSLGRFFDVLPAAALTNVRRVLASCCDGGQLVELNFTSIDNDFGNVIVRPQTLPLELPVFAACSSGAERVDVHDLTLSRVPNGFAIWSRSRGQRLYFHNSHLGTVHLYGDLISRFLSEASMHGNAYPAPFDWDLFEGSLPTLPRLEYGNVILASASWTLDVRALRRAACPQDELERWRARSDPSRYVEIVDGDKHLVVDLDSKHAAEILSAAAPKYHDRVRVQESFLNDQGWLRDSNGAAYSAEFVASIVMSETGQRTSPSFSGAVQAAPDRSFAPGSKWSYARVYLPLYLHDDFLERHVERMRGVVEETVPLAAWHFLRYSAGGSHVRLRFCARSVHGSRSEGIVAEYLRKLMEAGEIVKYEFATYEREIERYGGPEALQFIESAIFTQSSEVAIETIRCSASMDARVESAAAFAVRIAGNHFAFGFLAEWAKHYQVTPVRQSSEDRRIVRELYSLLARSDHHAPRSSPIPDVLAVSARVYESLVHMHCNRLGISAADEARVMRLVRSAGLSQKITLDRPPTSESKSIATV